MRTARLATVVFWWPSLGVSTGRWTEGVRYPEGVGQVSQGGLGILGTHPPDIPTPSGVPNPNPPTHPPPPAISTPFPVDRMTDACENVNSPQLLSRAVMMRLFKGNYRNFSVSSKTFLFYW